MRGRVFLADGIASAKALRWNLLEVVWLSSPTAGQREEEEEEEMRQALWVMVGL